MARLLYTKPGESLKKRKRYLPVYFYWKWASIASWCITAVLLWYTWSQHG